MFLEIKIAFSLSLYTELETSYNWKHDTAKMSVKEFIFQLICRSIAYKFTKKWIPTLVFLVVYLLWTGTLSDISE